MRNLSKKSTALIAGAALIGVIGSGAAYAYWSTSGSGTGSATTSAGAASLVVTQASAPTNMAPGVAAGPITVTVQNSAANSAYVAQVVVSIASVTGGAGSCSAADYDLTGATMTDVAGDLATTASATFSGATLGFHNSLANQDGCKGATVHLAYAVS